MRKFKIEKTKPILEDIGYKICPEYGDEDFRCSRCRKKIQEDEDTVRTIVYGEITEEFIFCYKCLTIEESGERRNDEKK